jgi:tRNA-modifying protein YgfZ
MKTRTQPDLATQVEAAHRSALALAQAELATLAVTGQDRLTWLNGLVTCDLVKRDPGHAVYGLAVARSGRVLADATVVVDEPGEAGETGTVLAAVPGAVAATLRTHLDHYLVMEDAEVAPAVDAFEAWALHGPRSAEVLDAARAAGAVGALVDRTGLGGAFLFAPAGRAGPVRAAIEGSLAALSGTLGDDAGWDALRLERAVPRFGVDFDDKTYPQEASLEKTAVSFHKGCYLGQEVVCMLEMRGHVKRRLVSLVLEGTRPPERGAPVTDEAGVAVGEVTSASPSPTLGGAVAFAMVKRAHTAPGTRLVVAGVPALVVERPA